MPRYGAGDGEAAVHVGHVRGGRFQRLCRPALAFGDQVVGRERDDRACHAHRPPGVRAAAEGDEIGIAGENPDRSDVETEPGGRYLGEAGLVPLTGRLRADHDLDDPVGARGHRACSRGAPVEDST
jgi:hypothetical protein